MNVSTALFPATILNGATTSGVIDLHDYTPCGLFLPAALTGTAITFTACDTINGTFLPVYNSAGAVSATVAASRYAALNPNDFLGLRYIKLVSGSTEGADRIIKLAGRLGNSL